jgi:hypothetical protein
MGIVVQCPSCQFNFLAGEIPVPNVFETTQIPVLDIIDRLIQCAEIRKKAALGSCGVNDSALPEVERFLLSLLKPCVILKDKPPA